jgi:hypothetical protein
MTKLHYLIILLGSALFFWDVSYGIGWLFGWVFAGLLEHFRERILERVIDFDNFSMRLYIMYLVGIMVWVAIPLLISFLIPEYINPLAVFGAFFADRMLMFAINLYRKGVK